MTTTSCNKQYYRPRRKARIVLDRKQTETGWSECLSKSGILSKTLSKSEIFGRSRFLRRVFFGGLSPVLMRLTPRNTSPIRTTGPRLRSGTWLATVYKSDRNSIKLPTSECPPAHHVVCVPKKDCVIVSLSFSQPWQFTPGTQALLKQPPILRRKWNTQSYQFNTHEMAAPPSATMGNLAGT